jgi:HNH endonuclease
MVDILLDSLVTCEICGGKLNPEGSVQHDHVIRARDGGETSRQNQRVTHPFCNNRRDQIEAYRDGKSGLKLPAFIYKSETQTPQQLKLFDDSFFTG